MQVKTELNHSSRQRLILVPDDTYDAYLLGVMIGGQRWTTKNKVGVFLSSMLNLTSIHRQETKVFEYSMEMLKLAGIENKTEYLINSVSSNELAREKIRIAGSYISVVPRETN